MPAQALFQARAEGFECGFFSGKTPCKVLFIVVLSLTVGNLIGQKELLNKLHNIMKNKIAVQMFTLRKHTKTAADFANSLKRVSDMGYTAVQLSAVRCMNGDDPEVSAEQARTMLEDNGLKCIATHRSWDAFTSTLDKEIAFHKTLGCDYAAIGGIPNKVYDATAEGYRRWIDEARAAGIQLFATDPTESSWENYNSEKQALDPGLTRGEMRDFNGGSIRFEFWKCFGKFTDSCWFVYLIMNHM